LDRFCAPLGDALPEAVAAFKVTNAEISGEQEPPSSGEILVELEKANLFIVSLDQQGEWFCGWICEEIRLFWDV
jgi:ATP/maltotriose-dependent transcriptional regulator MalT